MSGGLLDVVELRNELAAARALNESLAAQVDDARRQRDEAWALLADRQSPASIAVTVTRYPVTRETPDMLRLACAGQDMEVTTAEAVALITALLADGRVHAAWLHGRMP